MAGKDPKRPNRTTEALEEWDNEGGASASGDDSTRKPKRPRDLNTWARRMVDLATSDKAPDAKPKPSKKKGGKQKPKSLKKVRAAILVLRRPKMFAAH